MKISTRARYGTRAVIELAEYYNIGALSLKEISAKQNIPLKYLARIMFILKTAGIVKTVRGKTGGFVLAKPPSEITARDIFENLEERIAPKCRPCAKRETCPTSSVWHGLENAVGEYLNKIKIADLMRSKAEIKKSAWL